MYQHRQIALPKSRLNSGHEARLGARLKQFRGQNEKSEGVHHIFPGGFSLFVIDLGVVEICLPALGLDIIYPVGNVFGNKTVEQHSQHPGFEIPTIYAATQIIGNPPNRPM